MDRIDDTGEKNQPSFNTLIIPVRADINGILVHIENRERLYPEKYATLIAEINAMITEIASTVRARKSRKEGKEENTPATVS
jgi:hypothetical protein